MWLALIPLLMASTAHADLIETGQLIVKGSATFEGGGSFGNGWTQVAYASATNRARITMPVTLESSRTYVLRGWVKLDSGGTESTYFSTFTFNNDGGTNYNWVQISYNTTGIGQAAVNQGSGNSTNRGFPLCSANGNSGDLTSSYYCTFEYIFRTPPVRSKEVVYYGTWFMNDPSNSRWYAAGTAGGNYTGSANLSSIEFGGKAAIKIDLEATIEKYDQTIYYP